MPDAVNTLISIGNSDNGLPQDEWADFITSIREMVDAWADRGDLWVHGEWFSAPDSPWQNANWCVEIKPPRWYTSSEPHMENEIVENRAYPELVSRREEACRADMKAVRERLREKVRMVCLRYRQDTFAWTNGPVELVETGWREEETAQPARCTNPICLTDHELVTVNHLWDSPGRRIEVTTGNHAGHTLKPYWREHLFQTAATA